MKVLTKKLLTAFRVKMNTYYWELEKERRSTDSLEELLSYTGEAAHSCFFFFNLFFNQRQRGERGWVKKDNLMTPFWCMRKSRANVQRVYNLMV